MNTHNHIRNNHGHNQTQKYSHSSTELITVKSSTCKSLSGKSELSYHIACDNDIYFRLADNSDNGFFSCEWVKLSDIESVFDSMKKGEGITSFNLDSLFIGKSVNTPTFLLAVLDAKGLVEPQPLRQTAHDRLPSKEFQEGIFALEDAEVNIDRSKKPVKKASKPAPQAKTSHSIKSDKSNLATSETVYLKPQPRKPKKVHHRFEPECECNYERGKGLAFFHLLSPDRLSCCT